MTSGVLKLQLGVLELDLNDVDATGFIVQEIDLGCPTPRVVTDDLPAQDGADDQTSYFSSRTVQLTGYVVSSDAGSRSLALDSLMPFLRPKARPTLVYALDCDVDERCLDMRVGQWSAPITHPESATFSVQWVCPNPIAYEQSINEVDVPLAAGSTRGRTYPRTYPRVYPTSTGGGGYLVTTGGTYDSWPTIQIHGPCTDPAIYWLDPDTGDFTGTQLVFSGLTIDSGDYVEIDTRARTVLLNGDPGANRYNLVDFAATSWGPLLPGPNFLRFVPASADSGVTAGIFWRDSFLN